MKLKRVEELLEQVGIEKTYKEPRAKDIKIFDKEEILNLKGEFLYENKEKQDRYFLKIYITNINEEKELTVIMLNPSEKENTKNFVDQTVTNVIRIACENGYNQLNILNLITLIEPDSKNITLDQIKEENIEFIINFIKENNSDILVAWGEKVRNNTKNENAQKLIEFLSKKENVFTFCPNKKEFPKHPARIDFDCCKNCSGSDKIIKFYNYEF